MKKTILSLLPDAMLIAGAAAVSFGAWLLHPAAGFIVGGMLLLIGGRLAAIAGAK